MTQPLNREALTAWLAETIRIPSLSGHEQQLRSLLAETFGELVPEVFVQPFPKGLRGHEEYASDELADGRPDRGNLILRWPGTGNGRRLILQTHMDVVPWEGWELGLEPQVDGGVVTGRGAVDCKGQLAVLYQLAHLLGGKAWQPTGDLELQLVAEEEIGGNGALAAILERPAAVGVVVLEATGQRLFCANRGALWFRMDIEGRAVHMGRKWEGINAIEGAGKLMSALQEYEHRLVAHSRDVPLFEEYDTPVQVNIGTIAGGQWPSMVPEHCSLEGGVGFLPNKNRAQIKQELAEVVERLDDAWLREHTRLSYNRLKNEAFVTDPAEPVVMELSSALHRQGLNGKPSGWNVSCDARLYATVGNMPVVVFGPGDIVHAHAVGEQIEVGEIEQSAGVLADFVRRWYE